MIRTISPNKAIVITVLALLAYWIPAMFVPAMILRDIFNSLAFGTAIIITATWFPSAMKALREGADSGELQLILGIFIVWCVLLCQRIYVIVFNYAGRPLSWSDSAISGFWPFAFMVSGMLFLSAPGVKNDKIGSRAIWSMVLAVSIGSLIAGILIGTSISAS
jgi:hypothetical protein